jgi:hypothetical protein
MDNSQIEIVAERDILQLTRYSDPRREVIRAGEEYTDGSGNNVNHDDLVQLGSRNLRENNPIQLTELECPPVFSWPIQLPDSLMGLSDLPAWRNAYCMGSKGARELNQILDATWPFPNEISLSKTTPSGTILEYQKSILVNTVSPAAWYRFLEGNSLPDESVDTIQLSMYPNSTTDSDYINKSTNEIKGISGRLALHIQANPSTSVSDFFNKGVLHDAISLSSENLLHQFLPLRALKGKGVRLVKRGSSMVLHVSCIVSYNDLSIIKSARVWLLEIPSPGNQTYLKVIHFEWTDPSEHLIITT